MITAAAKAAKIQSLLTSGGDAEAKSFPWLPGYLPVVLNPSTGAKTTLYATTEGLSRIGFSALLEAKLPLGTRVHFLLSTPLGEVEGVAGVARCEPSRLAGRNY